MFSVLFVDDSSDLLIRIRTFLEKSGEIRVDPCPFPEAGHGKTEKPEL